MMRTLISLAALALAGCAATPPVTQAETPVEKALNNQVTNVALESDANFNTTLMRAHNAVLSRDLTIFDTIDHAAGAKAAGLDLPPTSLILFGNPKAGTALMQQDIRMALELPMKMLVYQVGDRVYISYPDVPGQVARYGIDPAAAPTPKIVKTLGEIAADAAGTPVA